MRPICMNGWPEHFTFACAALLALVPGAGAAPTQAPVVTQSNFNVRVVAANLTSGNFQRYETAGLEILKGLRPDVIALQEFNYASTNGQGTSTTNAIKEMVRSVFGTNFVYFRETNSGYSIPNGIISRWPILQSGSWVDDDIGVNNRGFAWARLGLPGTNELYVVSIHLKADGGESARRAAEAAQLKSLIQLYFPPHAFLIVAGDLNIGSSGETALATFKTFLSDSPVPTDGTVAADPDTNAGRSERYDYVLPSFSLRSNQVATVIGPRSFSSGLVFDSRVYTNLADVFPAQLGNSGASMMQHMAVVKDFRLSTSVTNFVTVPSPVVKWLATNRLYWPGLSNLTYTVQSSANLAQWTNAGSAFSATTNFFFTNAPSAASRRYFRVVYP